MQAASTTTIEYQFMQTLVQDGEDDVLVPVDVGGALTVRIRFKTPGGDTFDRTLDDGLLFLTDGSDGIVRYKFPIAEAEAGEWQVQGWVDWEVSEFYSDIRGFTLRANIPVITL